MGASYTRGMSSRIASWVGASIVACALIAGCEKADGPARKTSGALTAEEKEMLQSLPGGNTALVGGNYMRFQNYLQSSPFRDFFAAMDVGDPGLSAWMTCWAEFKNVRMLGAVSLEGMTMTMRFVMKGLTVKQIEQCATQAKYRVEVDADKRYIGVQHSFQGAPITMGYLVLPNGAFYVVQRAAFGINQVVGSARPELEADQASASTSNALADEHLVSMIDDLDRTRSMWFAGSAAGTAIADKLGDVFGTMDIAPGLRFDVTAKFQDPTIATQIADAVPMAKAQAKRADPDLATLLETLKVTRSGSEVRLTMALTDAQLQKLVDKVAPMMRAAAGAR